MRTDRELRRADLENLYALCINTLYNLKNKHHYLPEERLKGLLQVQKAIPEMRRLELYFTNTHTPGAP